MPYDNKRRSRSRKTYRKRKPKALGYNIVKQPNAGLPTKFAMTHRYVWNGTINPAIGGLATNQVFAANGLYDPDITGTGNQPRFFDQMANLYDHYCVIGAHISARLFNTDSSHAIQTWITTRDSTVAYTNPVDNTENARAVTRVLGAKGASKDQAVMTANVNPAKFLGLTSPLSEYDLRGTAVTNPAELVYFHVGAADLNGGNDPLPVECLVTIDYRTVWTEMIQPAQS